MRSPCGVLNSRRERRPASEAGQSLLASRPKPDGRAIAFHAGCVANQRGKLNEPEKPDGRRCCGYDAGDSDRFRVVGAHASVIYQSISNLYATPPSTLCSECLSDGQYIGEFFSLGASAVAQSLTFVVGGTFVPYTLSFTVDIFQDARRKYPGS
jgi:hypothetical protein